MNNKTVSSAIIKMIEGCEGNQYDICHFLKVWGYAKTIGETENLDRRTQMTLELAAIVHDIACPQLRKEHGNAPHPLQEKLGAPMAEEFLSQFDIDVDMRSRICWLVGHHHTYSDVQGADYRILLEADFLVNAGEQEKYRKAVSQFRENVFRTQTGTKLLNEMYPDENRG